MARSSPRRRCVGRTLTIVTPAAGTSARPGTVSPKENAPAVATQSGPSQTPNERPVSVSSRRRARCSGLGGGSPNARFSVSDQASHSTSRNIRNSVAIEHP
ncbi:hypothetical protein Sgleb_49880 [Streptomyces glebosus]|uniref:Uncharacterized protein n=1 Tax=Streptomyces glebosus TaxID=249580 RepID=A0A640T379_9ACTN|nr:hypothetical protein Sgleb_49880 [Streptomyces glebosus]GHG52619.1 hypothetical protein GCM10010513_12820 [Streptomyces glebosus]